jgi:hypothetical protein
MGCIAVTSEMSAKTGKTSRLRKDELFQARPITITQRDGTKTGVIDLQSGFCQARVGYSGYLGPRILPSHEFN